MGDVKAEFIKLIDEFQGVHLQCSRIKSLDSLLVKAMKEIHSRTGYELGNKLVDALENGTFKKNLPKLFKM